MTYPEKVKHLEEEIDRLEKEAEILQMQLVACSIISMSNTKTSFVFNQLPLDSPYRCASYENCENSVLREIDLLERNAELLAALENCCDVLEDYGHITPFHQAHNQARVAIAKAKGEKE